MLAIRSLAGRGSFLHIREQLFVFIGLTLFCSSCPSWVNVKVRLEGKGGSRKPFVCAEVRVS